MSKFLALFIFLSSLFLITLDFSKNISTKLKVQIFDCFCLLLIFAAGMKPADYCFDVKNYSSFFMDIDNIFSYKYKFGEFEPSYAILNSLIKTVSSNYHVLFFTLSTIAILLYRKIILQYSDNVFLSLFIYVSSFYFLNEMIVLRFGIASAIMFYNTKNIEKGNTKKYLFLSILATSFHYSAVAAFLLPFFYKTKNRNKHLRNFIIIVFISFFVFSLISPLNIIAFVGEKIPFLYDAALWHLLRYIGNENAAGVKRFILYIPFLYFALLVFLNYKKEENKEINYCQLLYLLLALLYIVVFYEVASMARINQLFLTSTILIGGNITRTHKNLKGVKLLYLLVLILMETYFFVRANFMNSGGQVYFT